MSLQKIHLRKLLQFFDASDAKRVALLRADIRAEINREDGVEGGGGDFYVPFWADAKNHAKGISDLTKQTAARIDANERRKRLYPQLRDGFLLWWDERRRGINEPVGFMPESLGVHFPIPELGTTVKIENILALTVGDHSHRIIYPYFSEEPVLTGQSARLGLWLLHEAMKAYASEDFRMLDVIRSKSFSFGSEPVQGNEKALFIEKYKALLAERKKLKKEY